MRSSAGVGMTPPNVLETPKPASSVMMSNTLGAPLGGTMRGAQHGVESRESRLMTPRKGGSGAGKGVPGFRDSVPAAEQPSGEFCCAEAAPAANVASEQAVRTKQRIRAV